jgi:hypothetical protein
MQSHSHQLMLLLWPVGAHSATHEYYLDYILEVNFKNLNID